MGYRQWKVDYIEDGIVTELTNVLIANPVRTLDAQNNTLEITLKNYNNECYIGNEIKYKSDQLFKVYAAEGFVDKENSEHLIGVYIISDFEEIPENRTVKITCADKTFNMLSRVFIGDETAPVNQLVNTIVQRVHMGAGAGVSIITTDIDSTTSGGSAFPTRTIASTTKTAYELISEFSQPDATGDNRIYMFWFDENEVFHWKYPTETITDTFRYGSYPVITLKNNKQESVSISTVIYNAGKDKNDTGITRIYHDATATSYRSKYIPMTEIARDLKSSFQRDGTYDAMSNEDFVAAVLEIAAPKAQAYVQARGRSLWETTIDVYGGKYEIGGKYKIDLGRTNGSIKEVRLNTINHTLGVNGWMTALTFEEDVEFGID